MDSNKHEARAFFLILARRLTGWAEPEECSSTTDQHRFTQMDKEWRNWS